MSSQSTTSTTQNNKKNVTVTTKDGRKIQATIWVNPKAKAYLHICHGMSEHIERYTEFAEVMATQEITVFFHNHRGHGENEVLGHYSDKDGWLKTIQDIKDVQDVLVENKELPLFLFAHSMGSFIAQGFAMRYGANLAGLILSGTNYQPPFMYYIGRVIAQIETYRLGLSSPSRVMDKLSFSSFNNHFKPSRTDFDWLSRDQDQVDQYIKDPYCGFPCSGETWQQLLTGLIEISSNKKLRQIPSNLPIYIFGGDKDPVGQMGKGIPALAKKLRISGHDNVTTKLYKGGRHEMLNEICKTTVHTDITNWIQRNLK
ncbi:MAG: alpha/beta hydrolase [Oleispira sp.]|nr:alpha/beta hydrolase [Oleispira sp.]|tara:strand:- start:151 stop:1092 length:942 start_codon:yes stop_codon:yes gene_type:complete